MKSEWEESRATERESEETVAEIIHETAKRKKDRKRSEVEPQGKSQKKILSWEWSLFCTILHDSDKFCFL